MSRESLKVRLAMHRWRHLLKLIMALSNGGVRIRELTTMRSDLVGPSMFDWVIHTVAKNG